MGLLDGYYKAKALNDVHIVNRLRILNDCIRIVMETTKPDVFFSRYELAITTSADLSKLTKAKCFHNNTPQEVSAMLLRDREKVINAFLDRYSKEITLKALSLTRGQRKRIDTFKLITSEFEDQFTPANIEYRDRLYDKMVDKVDSIS